MPIQRSDLGLSRSSEDSAYSNLYEYSHMENPAEGRQMGTSKFHEDQSIDQSGSIVYDASSKADDRKFMTGLKMFLATSIISAVSVLALEGLMFGVLTVHRKNFPTDLKYYEISIFLALFIFASCYQVVITVVGLHTKNMLLLSLLCLFYACMLGYTGIQYEEITLKLDVTFQKKWTDVVNATNIAVIAVLAVTFVFQVSVIYFLLWRSVRWFLFKKIGASFEIRRYYTIFQIHRCLLIFDFFFFLGFTVQFIVIMISNKTSVEFILTCCLLPFSILVLLISDYASTREFLWASICTTLCFIGGCVYVIFKMVRLYTRYSSAYNVAVVPGSYFPGRTSLVMFGVITMIFLFLTIVAEVMVMCNYSKGLLPYVSTYYRKTKTVSKSEKLGLVDTSLQQSILID